MGQRFLHITDAIRPWPKVFISEITDKTFDCFASYVGEMSLIEFGDLLNWDNLTQKKVICPHTWIMCMDIWVM